MANRKMLNNKKAQEEIVGFAIIVVIVSVILLFFLVFYLQSNKEIPVSYEASSFLQAALSYTSSCEKNSGLLPVDDLVVACYKEERCGNGDYSCDVLNQTLKAITDKSWPAGPDFKVKGYQLNISSDKGSMIYIQEGNITGTFKGSQQILPVAGAGISMSFTEYE